MSVAVPPLPAVAGPSRPYAVWGPVLAGFAAMYLPVYWWAAGTIWETEEHAHGPIVLAVLLWLFWGLRERLAALPPAAAHGPGWSAIVLGLVLYVLGRVLDFSILVFGSQPLVLAGGLLLLRGVAGLRAAWFPVFYAIFMIPLPGILVDALTGPLKHWISVLVDELLFSVGYPIARTGVIITIGPYQLLVADACSGLNSMFSLTALGTLFMYLMARPGVWHNAVMLALILPIAFVANIVRVIVLVLVTYHLGDEAGQGFLHGAAGIMLMFVALAIFFAVDALLALFGRRGKAAAR